MFKGELRGTGVCCDEVCQGSQRSSSCGIYTKWAFDFKKCEKPFLSAKGSGGPEELALFLVLNSAGRNDVEALKAACQKAIKEEINPLFKVGQLLYVTASQYLAEPGCARSTPRQSTQNRFEQDN